MIFYRQLITLLFIFGGLLLTTNPAASAESAAATTQKKLQQRLTANFLDNDMADIAQFLSSQTKTKIILEKNAGSKYPVTIEMTNVRLQTLLTWVCHKSHTRYKIRPNGSISIFTDGTRQQLKPQVSDPISKKRHQELANGLQEKYTVSFKETPLEDACSFLRGKSNLPIIIDYSKDQKTITLKQETQSLKNIFSAICKQCDVTCTIVNEAIYIQSKSPQ